MFKKLNISLSALDFDILKGENKFNNPTFKEFTVDDRRYLFDTLSTQVRFKILPFIANITEITYPGSNPHTDSWSTAINFYFDAGNDETCFWKEVDQTRLIKNKLTAFDIENLEQTSSFVAHSGDCYLLDVSSIHSVKMHIPNTTRKILRLGWFGLTFDQLLNSIEFLNN